MKTDRDAIISRKEQQEAQAKAEEERKAEIERIAKENANAQIKAFNADTGEILESDPIAPEPQETTPEMAKFEPSEPASYDLRITFPYGNPQAKFYKGLFERGGVTTETLFDGKTQEELTGGVSNVFD